MSGEYTEQGGGIRTVLPCLPAPSVGFPDPVSLVGPAAPFPSPTAKMCLHQLDSHHPLPCMHAQPCPTLCNPVGCSPPGCSVHWILQQEYWSGLPVPISGELPNPGIDPATHWPTRLCFSLPQQTHRTLEPVCSLIPGAGAPTVAEKVSALLTGAPGQPAAPSSGLRSHLCTSGWTIGGFRE